MAFKNIPKLTPKGIPYNYKEKQCKDCRKIFKPMTNVQKFCSLTCQNRDRRKRNKETIYAYNKMYEKKYPERIEIYRKNAAAKPGAKKRKCEYHKRRYREEMNFRVANLTRGRIYKVLRDHFDKKEREYMKDGLDYKGIINKLANEIPDDFKEKKYHIDHIRPLCSFDLTIKKEFIKAFAPQNHRWLLDKENYRKANEDRKLSIRRKKKE